METDDILSRQEAIPGRVISIQRVQNHPGLAGLGLRWLRWPVEDGIVMHRSWGGKKPGGKNLEAVALMMTWCNEIAFLGLDLLNLSWAGKSIWKRAADIQIFKIQKKPSLSNVSLGPLDIQRRHDFFRPSNFQGCAHRPKSHETIALSDLSQLTSRKTPGEFFIRPKKWGFSWRYPAKTNTEKSYYFYLFFQCVVTKINRLT